MTPNSVASRREGTWVVSAWQGEVDMANALLVERRSLDAVLNTDHGLIIDLAHATYLDSAGIRSLISIHRLLEERQQRLLMVLPAASPLRRSLEISGVPSIIPTFDSIGETLPHRR